MEVPPYQALHTPSIAHTRQSAHQAMCTHRASNVCIPSCFPVEVEAQNAKCRAKTVFIPPEKKASEPNLYHHVVVSFTANLDAHYDPPYLGHVIISSSMDAAVSPPLDGCAV